MYCDHGLRPRRRRGVDLLRQRGMRLDTPRRGPDPWSLSSPGARLDVDPLRAMEWSGRPHMPPPHPPTATTHGDLLAPLPRSSPLSCFTCGRPPRSTLGLRTRILPASSMA